MGEDAAFPTLTDAQLELLHRYGEPVELHDREFVFVEGQDRYDFVVVLEGAMAVVRHTIDHTEVPIARHTAGRFLGELNLLTGERTIVAARADEPTTRVLRITPERFRELMAAETDLADIVFTAFVARRDALRSGEGAGAIRIIGSRYSALAIELEQFARRQRLPHRWIDLDDPDVDDIEVLLASVGVTSSSTPVVITPTAVLRRPTVGEFAASLGVSFRAAEGRVRDLVVVGAGPGGIAAGVYGASEGLDTLVIDGRAVGGQAGASSRIENYFGFPNGISGSDLVEAGALQAQRLGATINAPCRATGLRVEGDRFVLTIGDADEVATRAVIVATGVAYRKLEVADLARFENAGVFYAATELEARVCGGRHVVVVGGGNSAGQAAVYLAQQGSSVTIVLRSNNLHATMSRYLIDRIEANPMITVLPFTQVTALHGSTSLEAVDLTRRPPAGTPSTETVPTSGVFSFIGSVPSTDWLRHLAAVDDEGFVLTDTDVPGQEHRLPFETSQPGLFAIGDVRHGSMKRVAAAVGEGSSAVRSVHQHLAAAVGR